MPRYVAINGERWRCGQCRTAFASRIVHFGQTQDETPTDLVSVLCDACIVTRGLDPRQIERLTA